MAMIKFALRRVMADYRLLYGTPLTQVDLAQALGVTQGHISNLANNRVRNINLAHAAELCKILRCEPRDLFVLIDNEETADE